MSGDPELPPAVSKTAPDAQQPSADKHHLGVVTLRSADGATTELDAHAIPPGALVILQALDAVTPDVLTLARQQLRDILGDVVAGRFLIADNRWRIWPVITEPKWTFTFRPAGENDDVTVALRSLADCAICGHNIPAGSFVVVHPSDNGPDEWAHESCARPQNPARPPLNAEQTRARS